MQHLALSRVCDRASRRASGTCPEQGRAMHASYLMVSRAPFPGRAPSSEGAASALGGFALEAREDSRLVRGRDAPVRAPPISRFCAPGFPASRGAPEGASGCSDAPVRTAPISRFCASGFRPPVAPQGARRVVSGCPRTHTPYLRASCVRVPRGRGIHGPKLVVFRVAGCAPFSGRATRAGCLRMRMSYMVVLQAVVARPV